VPVTVAVPPRAVAVKVTEQLVGLTVPFRVQLAPTVPTGGLEEMKLTVPVGAVGVANLSVTVAVHVEVAPGLIELGLQTTAVDVGCALKKLAVSASCSGTEPPVPPLVMVTQVFGTLVPVQTEPIT
jgi:hypothetical protein